VQAFEQIFAEIGAKVESAKTDDERRSILDEGVDDWTTGRLDPAQRLEGNDRKSRWTVWHALRHMTVES
jgi:hypothetical protein